MGNKKQEKKYKKIVATSAGGKEIVYEPCTNTSLPVFSVWTWHVKGNLYYDYSNFPFFLFDLHILILTHSDLDLASIITCVSQLP